MLLLFVIITALPQKFIYDTDERNSPFGVKVNDVHLLQLLKYVTSNSATAFTEVGWATAIPPAPSINPAEGTNTKTTPQVDFPCHGCYKEN